ncbi:DUF6717 family protein [Arcticibacter sp. MXS-1]|uniref:DUF6717 family protein n=1 Tax=Arcticibacter sp. MXS-1 TaxID=3341726 RepID=UPI0035A834B2
MMKRDLKFEREPSGRWYVVLPEYPGPKADLQMVAGADTMLERIAEGRTVCVLTVSDADFEEADVLKLIQGYHGEHGDYLLEHYRNSRVNHKMWLCPVVTYVFGRLPEHIYIRSREDFLPFPAPEG